MFDLSHLPHFLRHILHFSDSNDTDVDEVFPVFDDHQVMGPS
jgi:hypothetical protein